MKKCLYLQTSITHFICSKFKTSKSNLQHITLSTLYKTKYLFIKLAYRVKTCHEKGHYSCILPDKGALTSGESLTIWLN